MKSVLIMLVAAVALTGCVEKIQKPSPTINQAAALVNPPVETYPEPTIRTEGSLFSDDARMDLFADIKASRVGDIITINIVENSQANKEASTSTGRSNSLTANTSALWGLRKDDDTGSLGKMELDTGYDSNFSGTGSTNRDENMTAKMSARIIQVLPNGNLVLRGSQEILVNNEKQYITVQGVVRPADVAADNSVLSTHMADARIDYTGKGDLSRKQREGWLSRFVDVVWPF